MTGEADVLARRRVVIVGLGLVGGSLARALKASRKPPWIGASSLEEEELARAADENVVDRTYRDAAAAAGAGDLIVYAAPLDATLEMLEAHGSAWSAGAVITDVVSVKGPLMERVRDLGRAERFVGGHPMAGSERTGYGASRADLFRGARVHLVRGAAEDEAAGTVESLWRLAGARPAWIGAAEHDRRMARLSHLPQLLSSALATLLGGEGYDPDELGPGGRDMTRLAASSTELWEGLVATLAAEDAEALSALADELEVLRRLLEEDDLDGVNRYLARARRWKGEDGWS